MVKKLKKEEEWLEKCDTTFRTIILPVSFVITITWSFLFYSIDIFAPEINESEVFGDLLTLFAAHLTIFIIAIFFWCWSLFVKKGQKIPRLLRGPSKKSRLNEAKFLLKFLSLCLLWVSLFGVPAAIIVTAFAFEIGTNFAIFLYLLFFVVFFGITFKLSWPSE